MFIIPVYQVVTGKRVDNIPQWLIDVEGTELIKRGVNVDDIYKTECFHINEYTQHFMVYDRKTYNPNADNNTASLIGRYDYAYNSEDAGSEYIILY